MRVSKQFRGYSQKSGGGAFLYAALRVLILGGPWVKSSTYYLLDGSS